MGQVEAVKRKENTQVKLPLQNLWWSQDNLPLDSQSTKHLAQMNA